MKLALVVLAALVAGVEARSRPCRPKWTTGRPPSWHTVTPTGTGTPVAPTQQGTQPPAGTPTTQPATTQPPTQPPQEAPPTTQNTDTAPPTTTDTAPPTNTDTAPPPANTGGFNTAAKDPYWPSLPAGDQSAYQITGDMKAEDLDGTSVAAKWLVAANNEFRAEFGSQPLAWNKEVALRAQTHVKKCVFEHTPQNAPGIHDGENLAAGPNDVSAQTQMWADEWKMYNFKNGDFTHDTGHFSQMVWNDTTEMGCAWTQCPDQYKNYFYCHYQKPGNMGSYDGTNYYNINVKPFIPWNGNIPAPQPAPAK